jgi:hypothetical protein
MWSQRRWHGIGHLLHEADPKDDHTDTVIQRGGTAYRMYVALRQVAPKLRRLSFRAGYVERRKHIVAWLLANL